MMRKFGRQKKILVSIGVFCVVFTGTLLLRVVISYRTNTLSEAQVCNPEQSKKYDTKNELAIGTFGCVTPTPTTAPIPTKPAETVSVVTHEVATNPPPVDNPPASAPIDKDFHDPSCPEGEAHAFLDSRGGFVVGVYHPGDATPAGQMYDSRCTIVPLVYLYPTQAMDVSVEVQTTGTIYNSNPLYPLGGWKQVYAKPDGSLTYQGGAYKSLMYEAVFPVVRNESISRGIILSQAALTSQLADALTKYGLTSSEKADFLDMIVPVLHHLPFPYVYFALYDLPSKNIFDHLFIQPKPDTEIYFSAYFKPLTIPYMPHAPLALPQNPPKRNGFTVVEWGALIDE